jgi:hypothetical protein
MAKAGRQAEDDAGWSVALVLAAGSKVVLMRALEEERVDDSDPTLPPLCSVRWQWSRMHE